MSQIHVAHCFCGAVEIEARGLPLEMGYCHCSDCRAYSGAPLVSYVLWRQEDVRVSKGADLLASFNKSGMTERTFCTRCGGHVLNQHPDLGVVDMAAGMLESLAFEPSVHLHYARTVLPIRDGLPKLSDFPVEAGGSGNVIAE